MYVYCLVCFSKQPHKEILSSLYRWGCMTVVDTSRQGSNPGIGNPEAYTHPCAFPLSTPGLAKPCATWRIFLGCWESHWEMSQEMWCLGARLGNWSNMASSSLLVAQVCRQWVVLGQSPDYYHGIKRQFAKKTQRRRTRRGPRCSDGILRYELSVLGTGSSPRNLHGLLASYSASICFSCSGSCLPPPPSHGHFLTLCHTGSFSDTSLAILALSPQFPGF